MSAEQIVSIGGTVGFAIYVALTLWVAWQWARYQQIGRPTLLGWAFIGIFIATLRVVTDVTLWVDPEASRLINGAAPWIAVAAIAAYVIEDQRARA